MKGKERKGKCARSLYILCAFPCGLLPLKLVEEDGLETAFFLHGQDNLLNYRCMPARHHKKPSIIIRSEKMVDLWIRR